MSWVLAKFRKSYSIMCWCKKRHIYLREIFHFKILVLGFGRNTLWFNLLKNDLQGWNRIWTRRSGNSISWGNICLSSIRMPYNIFSLLVLSGTSYSLLFFLFVVTASPTCRILLFLIGIFPLQTAEVPLCVRTTFKKRSTSPLRSSFSPSSCCFLPFCYHQPFSW